MKVRVLTERCGALSYTIKVERDGVVTECITGVPFYRAPRVRNQLLDRLTNERGVEEGHIATPIPEIGVLRRRQ